MKVSVRIPLLLCLFFSFTVVPFLPPVSLVADARGNTPCELTWDLVAGPDPGMLSNGFDAIDAADPYDIWTIGTLGTARSDLLLEHWDGMQWNIILAPDVGNNGLPLYATAIETISPTEAWALGYYAQENTYVPFSIHWNGSAWSTVALPSLPNSILSSISGTSTGDVWAVGAQGSLESILLYWNGMRWDEISGPIAEIDFDFFTQVIAKSANDVYLLGDYRLPTGTPYSHNGSVLHWDGTNWSVVAEFASQTNAGMGSGGYERFKGFAVPGANDIWVLAQLYPASTHSILEQNTRLIHWNGTIWETIDQVSFPNWSGADLDGPVANAVWVIPNEHEYLPDPTFSASRWDGIAYAHKSLPMPLGRVPLNSAAVVSPDDVWIVGGRYNYPNPNQPYVAHGHLPCAVQPGAPTLTTPKRNGIRKTTPRLDWTDVAGAHYYELVVSRNLATAVPALSTALLTSQYKFTEPLRPGVMYYWHVRACNNVGCGEWSNSRPFRTKELAP